MLFIDGWYARRLMNSEINATNPDTVLSMAYWQLWIPLLFVQVVVLALAHRNHATIVQRNVIYLGVFLFSIASLYSLIGYEALKAYFD